MFRSRWDHLRFRAALHRRRGVEAALLLGGVVAIWVGGHAIIDIMGWSSTAVSAWMFLGDVAEGRSVRQRTRVVENYGYARQISSASLPAGYSLQWGTEPRPEPEPGPDSGSQYHVPDTKPYIVSDAVNALIEGAANPLSVESRGYRLPQGLASYVERCVELKKPAFNEAKVRLRADMTEGLLSANRAVDVQRTSYFAGVASNEMAWQQFELCDEERRALPEFQFAVANLIVRDGRLVDLNDSCLSNHIGVSTLVLTSDGHLAVQRQGDQMISANEVGIGASGSVDWNDLRAIGPAPTLQALLRRAMQREAEEELSARFDGPGARTWLTGHARYLHRGGKPEFFGISRTTTPARDLKPSKADYRFVAGPVALREVPAGSTGLLDTVTDLLKEAQEARPPFSCSNLVCLRMAKAYLERGGRLD